MEKAKFNRMAGIQLSSRMDVEIEAGILNKLPILIRRSKIPESILIVADDRTYEVAGRRTEEILLSNGLPAASCVLVRNKPLIPDDQAVTQVLEQAKPGTGLILAVGAGSINDLAKYAAYQQKLPYAVIPTAPSMDGYASSVAAMTFNGFKQTFSAAPPVAIWADPDVMATAPDGMFSAGMGDVLGKYTALADWTLGHIIEGETFSESIVAEVARAVDCVNAIDPSASRADVATSLLEALVLSGKAMLDWGNSRPASGSEHHLAHFWEMQFALTGHEGHLHGTKVGVATLLTTDLYHRIFSLSRNEVVQRIKNRQVESEEDFRGRVKEAFGPLAESVFQEQNGYYRNESQRLERQRRILEHWDFLRHWVGKHVPQPSQVSTRLSRMGGAIAPETIGIDHNLLSLSMTNAKEVRKRYTVFRLAEDIGFD